MASDTFKEGGKIKFSDIDNLQNTSITTGKITCSSIECSNEINGTLSINTCASVRNRTLMSWGYCDGTNRNYNIFTINTHGNNIIHNYRFKCRYWVYDVFLTLDNFGGITTDSSGAYGYSCNISNKYTRFYLLKNSSQVFTLQAYLWGWDYLLLLDYHISHISSDINGNLASTIEYYNSPNVASTLGTELTIKYL